MRGIKKFMDDSQFTAAVALVSSTVAVTVIAISLFSRLRKYTRETKRLREQMEEVDSVLDRILRLADKTEQILRRAKADQLILTSALEAMGQKAEDPAVRQYVIKEMGALKERFGALKRGPVTFKVWTDERGLEEVVFDSNDPESVLRVLQHFHDPLADMGKSEESDSFTTESSQG